MTLTIKPGDCVYIPFWVILEFVDATPPNPFIKCKVVSISQRNVGSPDGPTTIMACDVEIKPHLYANGIPAEYLIKPEDVEEWAKRIAQWFLDFKPT